MTRDTILYIFLIILFSFSLLCMYFQFFVFKNYTQYGESEDGTLIPLTIDLTE